MTWHGASRRSALWAPTAQTATLLVWSSRVAADATHAATMGRGSSRRRLDGRGRRQLNGAGTCARSRSTRRRRGKIETNAVTDPYSVALTTNSTRSVAVDLDDQALQPERCGRRPRRRRSRRPSTRRSTSCTSATSRSATRRSPPRTAGPTCAFTDATATGTKHLQAARRGGHQHRAPAAVVRHRDDRGEPGRAGRPACDLPSFAAGLRAAAGVRRRRSRRQDGFNWGYDPYHYSAPEGSYATDPDGAAHASPSSARWSARCTASGLQVVLDQVFNHTAGVRSGCRRRCSTRSCPGYYQRLNATGAVETSTCCQNVATEHAMAREAHGRLGRHAGRATTRSTASGST